MPDILRPVKVSPSLLPILRSRTQGELLALVLLHSEREYSITELADEIGVTPTAVLREVDRLSGGGILADRRVGRSRLVRARTDTPLYRPLSDLMSVSFGPMPVLTEALGKLEGVRRAYIYGSWAARYSGEPGPPPADVDVLVVGDPDADALFDLAEEASRRLRREVNVHRVTVEAWEADTDDPFLTSVRERPLVRLNLDQEV
ncbi:MULTISPECIES: ArsR family transcriptional regulator [unclassified Streptomyces]|uniref:ArsR family transcriptional regulator n=1 Tax=unclassified Streptomyces TaxID=2593676 RepID=UPI0022B6A9F4|nr:MULTISPECIES: ArsR family transcriptional regulator [unclassified Streptomyces]MCZ7414614.1 ArsR family transcriptional regulator [Streptomyces sp. WMMC897]MCZ7431542.1 ArsR family transcriptional regulator [Streptomyces sp. WMMC1477]